MDFQTFLVYTFLMTFCVGAGYMLALCPINKVNQEGRVERNRLYQAIVFSIILVYVVIVGEGGNLAASKIRNLECPSYEICLIDYGCGKFNRKIHIMEQYP